MMKFVVAALIIALIVFGALWSRRGGKGGPDDSN
jgi:hypothetical protein